MTPSQTREPDPAARELAERVRRALAYNKYADREPQTMQQLADAVGVKLGTLGPYFYGWRGPPEAWGGSVRAEDIRRAVGLDRGGEP